MASSAALAFRAAIIGLAIVAGGTAACGTASSASGGGQIQLRLVSQRELHAMCLRLLRPPSGRYIRRTAAKRAVENDPFMRRHGIHIAVYEAALARVRSKDPHLTPNHHVKWVLVSGRWHNRELRYKELYSVDARTGTLVDYMTVGDGCVQ